MRLGPFHAMHLSRTYMSLRLALIFMLFFCSQAACNGRSISNRRFAETPRLWLWAWERPEDLTNISDGQVGVAYFSGALELRGEAAHFEARRQPLSTSHQAQLMAVVRVEPDRAVPPRLTQGQLEDSVKLLLEVSQRRGLMGIQVDFDATASQRTFYAELLARLRAKMPEKMILSATALASWFFGDRWAARLPVDEVVLMAFRMGPEGGAIRDLIQKGEPAHWRGPELSLGLSLDEPITTRALRYKRLYLFKPGPWRVADNLRIWEERINDEH